MDILDLNLIDVSVLMVEDDTPSRIYCSKILKKLVREVYVAENGLEGLQIFKQNNIDIIVSDIGMPVMDGLEMSREIKKINKNIQIILTTALDNKNYLMQAIEIGINNYIVKPIQKDNLYDAVSSAAKVTLLEKEVHSQYDRIRKLSQAVAQSPSMVIIINALGEIEYVNNMFLSVTNLQNDFVIGNSPVQIFEDLAFAEKYTNYLKSIKETIKDDISQQSAKLEFRYSNDDDKFRWLSATLSAIDDGYNNIQNVLILLEDITDRIIAQEQLKSANDDLELRVISRTEELRETNFKLLSEIETRKLTERQLIKAKEEAESANKAKSTFLAKVSHELRTPLNGIIGISSILLSDVLNEKQRKFLEMVKLSADGLLDIINDILDFSKIEAGKLHITNAVFNFNQMLDNAIELYRHSALTKNLEISLNIDELVPEYFLSDGGRLRQVILNLVSNALKFTEKGSIKINVSVISKNDDFAELLFSITDTGIGIPNNKIEMLFQSFSQVDDSFTRKYGGTGLGLSISKEIIEMLNGKIWVESQEGTGSTFFFTVKLKITLKPELTSTNNNFQNYSLNNVIELLPQKLNVLIAEDSIINQEVLKQNLAKFDWNILIANNGKEACDIYKITPIDLIFMDIQMPEMDGLQATKTIRAYDNENSNEPVTIFGLTAHAFDEQLKEAKIAGMDECVTKPFKIEAIFKLVAKYFSNEVKQQDLVPSEAFIENQDVNLDFEIDINALLQTLNSNKDVLIRIIDYFVINIKPEFDKLKSGVENNDYYLVRSIAHKMKSEVGNFNATKTANLCRELENRGKDENFFEIEKYVNELSNHLDLIIKELTQYKNNIK